MTYKVIRKETGEKMNDKPLTVSEAEELVLRSRINDKGELYTYLVIPCDSWEE